MNIVFCDFGEDFIGISIRYLSSYIKKIGHSSKMLFFVRNRMAGSFILRNNRSFADNQFFNDKEISAIVKFLKEHSIEFVGMSIMTGHFFESIELMKKIRKFLPHLKFVGGGSSPNHLSRRVP